MNPLARHAVFIKRKENNTIIDLCSLVLSRLTNTNNRAEFSRTARSYIPTWVRSAPAPAPGPPDGRLHTVRFSVTAPSYCGNPSKPLPEAAADSCFCSSGSLPASHAARIHSPSASVTSIRRFSDLSARRSHPCRAADPFSHHSPLFFLLLSSCCCFSSSSRLPLLKLCLEGAAAQGLDYRYNIRIGRNRGAKFRVRRRPLLFETRYRSTSFFFFFFLNGVLHDGCMLLNSGHPVPKSLSHTHRNT